MRTKATSPDQVAGLYRDYLGADRGEIVIIGDFDPSEVLPILSKSLEGWKAAKPYARIERPFQENVAPRRETIATPDKENAAYMAGLSMPIKDDHPDYPALLAGNFILGGGGLRPASLIACARRVGSPIWRCPCSRQAPWIPGPSS